MSIFEAEFKVQWADCDANNHFRNTAFLDYAAQTRFLYFNSVGFPPAAFAEHGIGPVVLEDNVTYRRELRLLEDFVVQFEASGFNANGSRFHLINRILTSDRKVSAEIRSKGVWLNLKKRAPTPPPDKLLMAMQSLAKSDDYADID
ncbi:MAG: thioesterase family protein [Pseudomonadota bacterium]